MYSKGKMKSNLLIAFLILTSGNAASLNLTIPTVASIQPLSRTTSTTIVNTPISYPSPAPTAAPTTSPSTPHTIPPTADPNLAPTTPQSLPPNIPTVIPIFAKVKTQSYLNEKLASLGCTVPILSNDFRIWQGNETRELLLPITSPGECSLSLGSGKTTSGNSTEENDFDMVEGCQEIFTWEASIDIQSGDVLLVRIDDTQLILQATFNTSNETERFVHDPNTSVYQVTRTGHDHCDVTEGVLLDINPLKVDDRKIVTLYDKDLTLGINLLIVVSELWSHQCIRLRVTVKSDNCGENEDCSGKGICYSNESMDGYECQCCLGSVGAHCEEHDACLPNPCKNNGICVDISQGHDGTTFQCLCPYGYAGRICEDRTNPCTSMPCQNGASCKANGTQFTCICPLGYSGDVCQHSRNECDAVPCVHGICVRQADGYKCFCQPGFTGTNCDYEYNECASSPCQNGGTCTDQVGTFMCACGRGYTGKACQTKVDLCEPNPCPSPRNCVDQGNNYSCECPKGFGGPGCLIPIQIRTLCETNACMNGGTCWSNSESFYCACKPGFTGKTCDDEFVMETVNHVETVHSNEIVDLETPLNSHLNHLHNIYMAVGTLICALIVVALVVTACHCRVHKTYKHFLLKTYPQWPCKRRRQQQQQQQQQQPQPTASTSSNTEWFTGKNKAPTATPGRTLPSLDTADMYYTLDFSESQSSPLIQ